MRIPGLSRYAISSCVAVAMLADCGGSQQSIGAPAAMPQGLHATTHVDRSGSWMLPDAKKGELLYVGSYASNDVYVFTYPNGTLVGTLTGFSEPMGLCSDKHGNVWIANDIGGDFGPGEMVEYAHGGTAPLATLSDPNATPAACSVDPTTGNLAVANGYSSTYVNGALGIYTGAHGTPTFYPNPLLSPYAVSYDNQGDVFVVGHTGSFGFKSGMEWLPRGASAVEKFGFKPHLSPAGVFWDDMLLAVLGPDKGLGIYRYQVLSHRGKQVGSPIHLDAGFNQFWRQGSALVGSTPFYNGAVICFHYPAGGSPFKTINVPDTPWGVTISVAPR